MMRLLGEYLVKITTGGCRENDPARERLRLGFIAGWASIAGNAALTLLKLIVGISSGSVSLLANAAHTASDILTSVVVIIGFKISSKGPDQKHPYGHGRVEYLVGLIVAATLIAVGTGFIVDAYRRLVEGMTMKPSPAAVAVAFFSILAKELLYRFAAGLGKRIESEALLADAWHHRSDAFTSLLVLVAVGGSYFHLTWLDPVSALFIAALIIYTGGEIAYRAADKLIGLSPPPELLCELKQEALSISEVLDVYDLEIHDYGMHKSITIHIKIAANSSFEQAHRVAHRVQEKLEKKMDCRVVVHPDPQGD